MKIYIPFRSQCGSFQNVLGFHEDDDDNDDDDYLSPLKVGVDQLKSVISLPRLVFHLHFQVLQQLIWNFFIASFSCVFLNPQQIIQKHFYHILKKPHQQICKPTKVNFVVLPTTFPTKTNKNVSEENSNSSNDLYLHFMLLIHLPFSSSSSKFVK